MDVLSTSHDVLENDDLEQRTTQPDDCHPLWGNIYDRERDREGGVLRSLVPACI